MLKKDCEKNLLIKIRTQGSSDPKVLFCLIFILFSYRSIRACFLHNDVLHRNVHAHGESLQAVAKSPMFLQWSHGYCKQGCTLISYRKIYNLISPDILHLQILRVYSDTKELTALLVSSMCQYFTEGSLIWKKEETQLLSGRYSQDSLTTKNWLLF